ncbi:alpha/beta hydrolase fold domain-containing protein [Lapidilactobacillus achengensis]|uniref:Alpha/beta hydrolase fold domain-containing protein n=1 Tax=Lapidilactobacillus achengensis TaxID=2486000 RepID=A0ABW1URF9_9LACO|nr:alpha/beta hydrolase [Lapidilactobacillus achengensis]
MTVLPAVPLTVPLVDETRDITYENAADSNYRDLKMSLLIPRTPEPKPAVLYFPGGGFIEAEAHKLVQLRLALAERGMVVAAAEYRVIPDKFPALVHDGKSALLFLHQHAQEFGIDPRRIAVLGDSAGGYLAQFLGTTSGSALFIADKLAAAQTTVAATVSLYGISDLRNIGAGLVAPFHDTPTATEALLVNGVSLGSDQTNAINAVPQLAAQASPISYVKSGLNPFLLMHGSADDFVSPVQSLQMATALQEKGVAAEAVTLTGAGHGSADWFQPSVIAYITDWLARQLRPENTTSTGTMTL